MRRFTNREREVLFILISGLNNHEISEKLCISNNTTKIHVKSIFRKLNVINRVQAVIACYFLCTDEPKKNRDFLKEFEKLRRN